MNPLKGIVLAGGKSTRMGTDKAFLTLQGRYFYQTIYEKLRPFCTEVIVSVNKNQVIQHPFEYPVIVDTYEEQGPLGGLLTAFNLQPATYIMLGVDMLKVQHEHIQSLIHNHDIACGCTMYFNANSRFYEPMLSIWEPTKLKELAVYFNKGGRSFQKFLNSISINAIPCNDCSFLYNVNTPDSLSDMYQ